jgi:hypothetical protein
MIHQEAAAKFHGARVNLLGMNGGGLVRYLDDNIAQDRLHPGTRRA